MPMLVSCFINNFIVMSKLIKEEEPWPLPAQWESFHGKKIKALLSFVILLRNWL